MSSVEQLESQEHDAEKFPSIQEAINRAPAFIEAEMIRSPENSWPACVNTQLSTIGAAIQFAHLEGAMSDEEYEKMNSRVYEIAQELKELPVEYLEKRTEVPEEIKNTIIQKIESIASA